jgi:hypothetical protein
MSVSRPLKTLSSGSLQELLTSEEDWLAYRTSVYLSEISVTDLSAISSSVGGNLVGTYENTVYTGSGTTAPQTYIRESEVFHSSNAVNTHTTTFTHEEYFPGTVFAGDLLTFRIVSTTSHSGSGFDSILHELSYSGTASVRVVSVVDTPNTATIDNLDIEWSGGSLSSTYISEFTVEVESDGSLEFSIVAASIDASNSIVTSFDNVLYPTINVEAEGPPLFVSYETDLYQNNESVGAFISNGTDKKNPVFWDRSNNSIKEMSNAELDVLCERLLKKVMLNEYPGTFRLATTGDPDDIGADWEVFIQDVFSDTRYDGSIVNYSIFIRKN